MIGYLSGFDNDLVDQLDRMRREMDDLFSGRPNATGIRSVAAGGYPPINIGVSPEQVDVYVFAAGMDPKGFDITLQQNLLSLSGTRGIEQPEESQCYRNERFDGEFRRVINLPEDVDPDRVNATYRNGVLHITLRRREEVRSRQIEVK